MTFLGWTQILISFASMLATAWPLGRLLAAIADPKQRVFGGFLGPVERVIYRFGGIDPQSEMGWRSYALALLLLNGLAVLATYALFRLQNLGVFGSLNPRELDPVSPQLSFNTAISFVTNTSWQSYVPEGTMSHGSQMLALTAQSFLSAATGIAIALAVSRAFARNRGEGIGNFWVDLTRITLYLLLPLATVIALFLVAQGVPQTLTGGIEATTLEGLKQTILVGPIAFQEAIKLLSGDGGGFFNANSAHPLENPTALTDMVEVWAMAALPFALPIAFGHMVKDRRQGHAILWVMGLLLAAGLVAAYIAEAAGNPMFGALGIDPATGNMEGKEVRFGTAMSTWFGVVGTGSGDGAVNAMLDSFTPIGGLIPMFLIQLGEIAPGGPGSGLYSFLIYVILAMFTAGLMVGRTPEYLGKKIQVPEMRLAVLAYLVLPLATLGGTALCLMLPVGSDSLGNAGAHGLSEMLYAWTSATGNNGSAFAGLSADTLLLDIGLGVAMMLGRYAIAVPVLAIAGAIVVKPKVPESLGTFPTHGRLFVCLMIGVILILGGLEYVPALSLGPIVEHLQLAAGKTF